MLCDGEVTAHRSRCRLQYLQQAHGREVTREYGIEGWRGRSAAEIAVVASVARDEIGPAWSLFGGSCRLSITMADDRERVTRA
jgi:hypothetical protein